MTTALHLSELQDTILREQVVDLALLVLTSMAGLDVGDCLRFVCFAASLTPAQ